MNTKPLIIIATTGTKTHATAFGPSGEATHAYAECKDGDKPNPIVGAIIAMCKALEVKPKDAALDVLRAYAAVLRKKSPGKAKPKVQVVKRPDPVKPKDGEVVGLIGTKTGHVELRFTQELGFTIRSMGTVGKTTKFVDRNGKQLQVGDLVTVEILDGTTRSGKKWKTLDGLHFVVDEDSDDLASKGMYIMGMCGGCNEMTGEIDSRFRIRLAKKWYEVELGEEHDLVRTVWKEKSNG